MTDQFNKFLDKMEGIDGALDAAAPKAENLAEMNDLVQDKLDLEKEIAEMEAELNSKKKDLTDLDREKIPNKMIELGLSKLVTKSGAELSINKVYRGNISEKYAEHALDWFIETNQADSIKNAYTVTLGVGKSEEARKLEQALINEGFDFKNKKDIAWNTLASIIKDLDQSEELSDNEAWNKLQEQGKVPKGLTLKDALGVYDYYETKVKFKKK